MTDVTTTKKPGSGGLRAQLFGKDANLVQILLEGRAFFALIAIILRERKLGLERGRGRRAMSPNG